MPLNDLLNGENKIAINEGDEKDDDPERTISYCIIVIREKVPAILGITHAEYAHADIIK